jgi:hypothetical protein
MPSPVTPDDEPRISGEDDPGSSERRAEGTKAIASFASLKLDPGSAFGFQPHWAGMTQRKFAS